MSSENEFDPTREQRPKIVIRNSREIPNTEDNPFFDPEIWGRANSPEEIYLPDADEILSFSTAAHEIGHLVKEGKQMDAGLDNFEAVLIEEQRAWNKGWPYLQKYLTEYFPNKDGASRIAQIRSASKRIEKKIMLIQELSRKMYVPKGTLDNLTDEEIKRLRHDRVQKLYLAKKDEIQPYFNEIKKEKNGIKPDWNKFVEVVTKAVRDILRDNEKGG